MNSFSRGIKNALRNPLRTIAVMVILAIGIGLSLSMLVANQAVADRIDQLKTSLGTNLTINPAGARGFQGGGEPLTTATVEKVEAVTNVSNVYSSLELRLRNSTESTTSTNTQQMGPGGEQQSAGSTDLESAIDAGTLGRRGQESTESTTAAPTFTLPVTVIGVNSAMTQTGSALNITSGTTFTSTNADSYQAIVGKTLAEKNSLKVGSTFMAYDKTFTVVGIFDQSTTFDNAQLYIPLLAAQSLSEQADEVSAIVAVANSLDNVASAKTALETSLGDAVDVTSSQENVQTAIDSLGSVQKVSIIGFIAALIAAGVIIFLIMFVIVRERRREIGVLKAIGAGNGSIIKQFMTEAMVLIVFGAVVGVGMAYLSSGSIANALVSSNATTETTTTTQGPGGMGGGPRMGMGRLGTVTSAEDLVGKVTTSLGVTTLLAGLGAAFLIAIIGSAIPAWMTAKVRPSEVMRGE